MLSRLVTVGLRKGLFGGSRRWLYVGLLAALGKLLRRMAESKSEVVYREELKPGEVIVVDHQGAMSRSRSRRR